MADSARLIELRERALRASSVAGMYALIFGIIFYVLLYASILGLVPLAGHVALFTAALLGIPYGGALFSVVIFWSLVVYTIGFALRIRNEGTAKTSPSEHVLLGSLAMLAFCAAVVHLIVERRAEINAANTKKLVLEFVQQNEFVVREVGGNAKVTPVSTSAGRNGLVQYEVSVAGTPPIYAIVNASTDPSTPRLTLLCTTSLPMGQRDPRKHACNQ